MDVLQELPENLAEMDYSSFVGLTRERNRPSGGIATVHRAALHARLGPDSRVLEIGSNTGFTSINLSLLSGASVVGVDVNPDSVAEATRHAERLGVADRVRFEQGDARTLAFGTEQFDAVWISNVASFVDDKLAMIGEAQRVLKWGGILIAVPIYYRTPPPAALVDEVSTAIGARIDVTTKEAWHGLFGADCGHGSFERYHEEDFEYLLRSEETIAAYCAEIMAKDHLRDLPARAGTEVGERLRYFMDLFNRNLQYAGFSIQLSQKRRLREETELFTSRLAV